MVAKTNMLMLVNFIVGLKNYEWSGNKYTGVTHEDNQEKLIADKYFNKKINIKK